MIHAEPRYWTDQTMDNEFLEVAFMPFAILCSRVRIAPRGYVFFQDLDMTWVWEPDP